MARILVIEDEEMVRLTVKQMLEAVGHEVTTAVDGEDGLRRFRQQAVDLVLCDVFMPRKSGIATLKELREVNVRIPVVMMSGGTPIATRDGTAPVDHLELARLMGASATIAKPFRTTKLLALMQKHLGGDPPDPVG